jgi:hypothetical protein
LSAENDEVATVQDVEVGKSFAGPSVGRRLEQADRAKKMAALAYEA